MTLITWLRSELEERGWSLNELGRRAGVSGAQVSHVLNERSNPGADFCIAIAKPLDADPVTVLRLAGILPPVPVLDADALEAARIVAGLNERDRAVVMKMLRGLLE